MTEKHRQTIDYLKNLHKHPHLSDYNAVSKDLDDFNCSFPSLIDDTDEIRRFDETHPRDMTIIYRARENETIDLTKSTIKLPFKTVGEISIIPDDKKDKIKFGRCNKPKEPRFYSSNDIRTACMEALTNGFTKEISESKHVTIGRWKIKEPLTLATVNYSEKSLKEFLNHDVERYEKMLKHTQGLNAYAAKIISEHGQHDLEFSVQALEIFADEFAKVEINEDYDYTISNYYCDNIFDKTNLDNKDELVDGIIYPAVSMAYQETNLVLHPRAMKKIEFLDASLYWLNHNAPQGTIDFPALESNVKADKDGNIQWTKFKW